MVFLVFSAMHPFHKKSLKHHLSATVPTVQERRGLSRSRTLRSGRTAGFSLVELIVAVAIFITLTTTLLFNYGSFDRRVTLDILAHQIAVWVHDAQVSAMSARYTSTGTTTASQFRSGYGIHFDTATPKQFIYFADLDKDRTYDPIPVGKQCGDQSVECEQVVTLLQGNIVSALCGDRPLATESTNCASATPGSPALYTTPMLDIVFMRPDPFTASIWGSTAAAKYSHAEITVSSPSGYRHTITAWITGQVSVR
jgi:type II secretory pathway pseudopilin PulG